MELLFEIVEPFSGSAKASFISENHNMTRHHRGSSAVAKLRHHLRQLHLRQLHQEHQFNAATEGVGKGRVVSESTPTRKFHKFMDLPFEIRLQIYGMHISTWITCQIPKNKYSGCIIGNRTIHLEHKENLYGTRSSYSEEQRAMTKPMGFKCQVRISEADDYADHTSSRRVQYGTEAFFIPYNCYLHTHGKCLKYQRCTIDKVDWVDLRLLRVSHETHREATRLLYATNTFSFEQLWKVEYRLDATPTSSKLFISSLHLDIPLVTFVYIPDSFINLTSSTLTMFDIISWTPCRLHILSHRVGPVLRPAPYSGTPRTQISSSSSSNRRFHQLLAQFTRCFVHRHVFATTTLEGTRDLYDYYTR